MRFLRYLFDVSLDAFYTFLADDGWAISSHIALSTLMAMFPFLIVITSLAGFFGSKELADEAAALMLQTWPKQVAATISGQIHDVLTTTRTDALTIGAVLSLYFASNGVEALRVALNRAYAVVEPRRWYWLRLESIGYTLIAAFTALAMAFLLVLGPLIMEAARHHLPVIVDANQNFFHVSRYSITISAMVVALFILHAWLPAGRRGFLQILPGIDGIEAIRQIRKLSPPSGHIAIIGVSGRGDDAAAARAAGADAFLLKPVSPRSLATALLESTRRAEAAT